MLVRLVWYLRICLDIVSLVLVWCSLSRCQVFFSLFMNDMTEHGLTVFFSKTAIVKQLCSKFYSFFPQFARQYFLHYPGILQTALNEYKKLFRPIFPSYFCLNFSSVSASYYNFYACFNVALSLLIAVQINELCTWPKNYGEKKI
jgi:hypothetical protein